MIVIALRDRQRWLLAGMGLFVTFYLFLTAKEFAASVFAGRMDGASLELAVRLSPGNADYRHRLGRYFALVAADPQSAADAFHSAVRINSHEARYWFDLAAVYQVAGDSARQRAALEQAIQAEPTAPDVAWEAANFFLVSGDLDRALHEFRVVVENDPYLIGAALQTCWRVRPDPDALLRDVVPPRTDTLLAFLALLASRKEVDGAIKTWDHLLDLHQKFPPSFLLDHVRFLISAKRPDAALDAWEKTAPLLGLSAYMHSPDNLIVNGDFSLNILNGGYDWTYVNRNGVRLLLDPSAFHEGQRSLSVTFEGPGISDVGMQQLVPVRGGSPYEFTAFYKSADFQGAGGPTIVLRDAYTHAVLFASDPLNDSDVWKEVHTVFTPPESTSLLLLSIERTPAGSPIRGQLWLDDFQLSPADSQDEP